MSSASLRCANILDYTGSKSRGVILLIALQEGRSVKDVARIIKKEVKNGERSSAIYVICDRKSIVKIESFGTKVYESQNREKKFVVTTNHFHHLEGGMRLENSVLREKYLEKLGSISEENVLKLAVRHRNPAICRHGRTLASFAVFKKHDHGPKILYSIQEPCKGYKEF